MNLIKFAKLALATLAVHEVIRSNSPVYLPVGISKATTVATAVLVSRVPEELLDPLAAVGALTVVNTWLNVDAVPEWGRTTVERAKARWRQWRGAEASTIPSPEKTRTAPASDLGPEQRVPRF